MRVIVKGPVACSTCTPVTALVTLLESIENPNAAVPPASDGNPFTTRSWVNVPRSTEPGGNAAGPGPVIGPGAAAANHCSLMFEGFEY